MTDQIVKQNVRVEWQYIGEGLCGDYTGEDGDVELLRFYVSVKNGNEWTDEDDASYCTRMPRSADRLTRRKGLEIIMDAVYENASQGLSIKKICETLSWIDPSWTNSFFPVSTYTFFADDMERDPVCCGDCDRFKSCKKWVEEYNTACNTYPHACIKCRGSGLLTYYENLAPHGAGTWLCEMSEPCSCIEDGKCARCAQPLVEKDADDWLYICESCGWNTAEENAECVVPEKPVCTVNNPYW